MLRRSCGAPDHAHPERQVIGRAGCGAVGAHRRHVVAADRADPAEGCGADLGGDYAPAGGTLVRRRRLRSSCTRKEAVVAMPVPASAKVRSAMPVLACKLPRTVTVSVAPSGPVKVQSNGLLSCV